MDTTNTKYKDSEEIVWIVDKNDNELGSATR